MRQRLEQGGLYPRVFSEMVMVGKEKGICSPSSSLHNKIIFKIYVPLLYLGFTTELSMIPSAAEIPAIWDIYMAGITAR